MEYTISLFKRATQPYSHNEDIARQEFILNVLLLGATTLLFVAIVIDVIDTLIANPLAYEANSLSSVVIWGLFFFFVTLYVLSRKRFVALASYLLLGSLFFLSAYMGYTWGIDVPAQIVFYPLIIVMAGILISTRFAFATALMVAVTMGSTAYLQQTHIIPINQYWKSQLWTNTDVMMIILIYLIVAVVSWLSNRELEKSLERARRSEKELKDERDSLEMRVEERTHELRKAEMEKMSQTYHFVEFGRLASGIFHDLMNPLTALSLNIARIADVPGIDTALSDDIKRAKLAAAHMQQLMDSMRRYLVREGGKETFFLRQTLEELVQVLSAYARAHIVTLSLHGDEVPMYGDPVAVTQVVTNLVSNAIQSYPSDQASEDGSDRNVIITLTHTDDEACVVIEDHGSGIPEAILPKIFEPFFTTKDASKGMGIGLSLVYRILEKDLKGRISVQSIVGKGSVFTVYLPIREP